MRPLVSAVRLLLAAPLVAAARWAPVREAVARDILRQLQPRLDLPLPVTCTPLERARALRHPPLRTVLYARLTASGTQGRVIAGALRRLYPGEPALYITCSEIGPGLLLMHGFATIVVAERIGRDCQVSQQVTVGYSDRGGPPVIGDRVRIAANAVVIGPVTLGDDSVVGAGAVVIGDVAPGTVVGGVPARPLPGAADRFSARAKLPGS